MTSNSFTLNSPVATMNRLGLALLSLGHFTVDFVQAGVPILLPFVFKDLNLNYTTAALIVTVASLVSSVIQPLFGYVADKLLSRWLLPLSCLLACVGLALAGQAGSYGSLMALVIVGSLGVAMYHPEAARTANAIAGSRKAGGMSLFVVGGNFGTALGPVLFGTLLATFGRSGAWGLLSLGIVVFGLFLWGAPALSQARASVMQAVSGVAKTRPAHATRSMALIISVIAFRQWTQSSLLTFVPLYYVNYLHQPATVPSQLLTALALGGICGTLIGGALADRFGRKPVILISLTLAAPLLFLFLSVSGALAFAVLFLAGGTLVMTLLTTVVMAQEVLPDRTALAAGLTLGFGVGLGGVGGALLGRLADVAGIQTVMLVICVLPLVGAALSVALPRAQTIDDGR